MSSAESMIQFVAQATDLHGQLMTLVFLSAIMGLGKGGVPGFATISTALVIATVPIDVEDGIGYSVSLMVPILSMIDVYAAWLHKKCIDWPTVWLLLPFSFVGMAIGQLLDKYMTDRLARLLVGSILLSILVLRMRTNILSALGIKFRDYKQKDLELPILSSSPLSRKVTKDKSIIWWAFIVGIIGGAATMLTNSMGAILNVYLLSVRKLSPESYIGTRAMFFCFLNIGKLPMRFAAGTLGWPMLPIATWLGIVAVFGVYCAKPIMLSITEKTFVKLELWVVALAALKLLLF